MNIFIKKKDPDHENRLRLQKIVNSTKVSDTPNGWQKKTFAVGGLSEVGFSKNYPQLLLIVSSQGRGVIDCLKFEMTDRDDNTDFDWINSQELWSFGIGKLADEKIIVGGLDGGGLPHSNKDGDSIEYMAIEWPIVDLIFQPSFKSIFNENEVEECFKIFHDYELRNYGFSYDGQCFVIATSSEINVFRKE